MTHGAPTAATPPAQAREQLETLVASCLPEGAGLQSLRREGPVVVASFADADGRRHAVAWGDAALPRASFRRGERLAFSYRKADGGSAEPAIGAIAALLACEERLVALDASLPASPEHAESGQRDGRAPGRLLFLREVDLSLRIALAVPRAGSVRAAARAIIERELGGPEPASEVHLYFEARCAQACEFCEEPRVRDRPVHRVVRRLLTVQQDARLDLVSTGALDELLDALWSRSSPVPLTITGNDWLRHPHLASLLASLERPRRARLRVQGPSLELSSPVLARRVAALPGLEWVATTLQSSDPAEHDAMVGLPGAHARLVVALERLAGTPVRLTLVLTRRAVRSLPATRRWLRERRWSVAGNAFLPDRALGDVSHMLPWVDELRGALEAAGGDAAEAVEAWVGVPLCAIPAALRHKAAPAVATAERDRPTFAAACSQCAERPRCPGLTPGYLQAFGPRGLQPL
jgi:hypothetical protein